MAQAHLDRDIRYTNGHEEFSEKLSEEEQSLRLGTNGSEQGWTLTVSGAAQSLETDLAFVEAEHTEKLAVAAHDLANAQADALAAFVATVATADRDLAVDAAPHAQQWANDDADARRDFQQQVAADFAAAVAAWHTSTDTAGSAYRHAEADAGQTFVNTVTNAEVAHTASMAGATLAWANSMVAARHVHVTAELAAETAHAEAVAQAVRTHVVDVAWWQFAYVQQTAAELDDWNAAVVGFNKTLKDQEVNEQKTRQDAVDDAQFVYQRGMAQARYDESVSGASLEAAEDGLRTTKDTDTANAERNRANNMALARQTWTEQLGNQKVDYTAAVGAAYVALVEGVTSAGIDYIGARANAATTRVQALATADEAFTMAVSFAEASWQTAAVGADQTLANTVAGAVRTYQNTVGTAKINFETAQVDAHALVVADWAAQQNTDLAAYTSAVAQAGKTWTHTAATARIARLEALTAADEGLAVDLNAAAAEMAATQIDADELFVNVMAAARRVHAVEVSNAARAYANDVGAARAARINAAAAAESDFGNSVAEAQRDFDNALAGIAVGWVGQLADLTHARHVARYTVAAETAFNADKDAADANRKDSERGANVTRMGEIGDALVQFAQDEGDADVQLATAVGTARVTMVEDVVVANNAFGLSRKNALIAWTTSVAGSEADYDNDVAEASVGWTADVVVADVAYSAALGLADVARAGSVAEAEADYHVAVAEDAAAEADDLASTEPSNENDFRAHHAQAYIDWLTNLTADYIASATGAAEAEAAYAEALTQIAGERANALALAVRELVEEEGAAAVAFEIAVTTSVENFRQGDLVRSGTRQVTLAGADKTLNIKLAEAHRAYGISAAQGEKNYAIAQAQEDGEAPDTRPAHNRAANVTLVLAKGAANIQWVTTAAAATSVYVLATADALHTAKLEAAAAQQVYENAIAAAYADYDVDKGEAEEDFRAASAAAGAARDTALAGAEGTFLAAAADETENALADLALEIDLPWTQFLVHRAEAEALWAADFAAGYGTFVAGLSALDVGYAGAAAAAYASAVGTIAAADLLLATSMATEDYNEALAAATAERAYTTAMTVPEELYAVQQATQAQTHAAAMATVLVDELTEENFNRPEAEAAAQTANRAATATLAGGFGVSQADANHILATATAGAQQLRAATAANARYARDAAVATARVTYATAEANAWYDREAAAAGLTQDFAVTQSAGYANRMTAMATAHPSPWSSRERDIAIAEAARVADEAAADETRRLSHAGAARAKEIADALAEGDLFSAEALAARDRAIAEANADLDNTQAAADALVDLAASGWHRPAGSYATGLSLANIDHPTSANDWWKFEQDEYFANLIGEMFGASPGYTPHTAANWHNAPIVSGNEVDRLQEDIFLPEVVEEPTGSGTLAALGEVLGNGLLGILSQTSGARWLGAAASAGQTVVAVWSTMWPGGLGASQGRPLQFDDLKPSLARDVGVVQVMLEIMGQMNPKTGPKWKPKDPMNPGEFGAEFDRRMAEALNEHSEFGRGGYKWYPSVVVDKKTGKVLSIGEGTGNAEGSTQFDTIRYRGKLEEGDYLDPNKVIDAYEFKAGDTRSRRIQQQIEDQAKLLGRRPKLVQPPYRYTAKGFVEVPEVTERLKPFRHLGSALAALPLVSLFSSDVSASDVRELIRERQAAEAIGPSGVLLWASVDLRQFLEKFIDDSNAINVIVLYVHKLEADRANAE